MLKVKTVYFFVAKPAAKNIRPSSSDSDGTMPTAGASRIGALVAEEVQTQEAHDRYITAPLFSLILKCRLFVFFNTLLYILSIMLISCLGQIVFLSVRGDRVIELHMHPSQFFLDLCNGSFSLFF